MASVNVDFVLSSGYISQGPVERDFEKQVQHHLGKNALTLSSGSAALELAYNLIGIKPGDKVITTPMTCFATNAPLVRMGAKIVWADVDLTGNISPSSVQECLAEHPDTKAIVVVDWAGTPADILSIRKIVGELGLDIPIVEDAAHRWDTKLSSRPHGDYVVYSTQAIKFLTTGDGGVLVTPTEQYARARRLRWFGLDRDNDQSFRSAQDIPEAGFKFHMNDISAAIGMANIVDVGERLYLHRENAFEILTEVQGLTHPFNAKSQYWMLPLLVENRKEFIRHMESHGVEAGVVHSRNDDMSCTIKSSLPYVSPMTGIDEFSERQVNIPCGWWLTREDRMTIKNALNDYFKDER
jgi:dTDP-4-amino-4,6-dideoxygalactose transaminase